MNRAKTFMRSLIIFTAKVTHFSEQFTKFLYVGVLNTAFGYAAFAFFVFFGFNYIFAPLFSTVAGVLFNFKTIGCLVFGNKNNRLIFKFFGVYAIVYLCNVLALKAFAMAGLTNMYISGIILVIPLALIGYGLNKKFVFQRRLK